MSVKYREFSQLNLPAIEQEILEKWNKEDTFEKSVAEAPPDRTSFPPSPGLSSMLDILVPSGMLSTGSMFPVVGAAVFPMDSMPPTWMPKTAGMYT